MSAAGIAYLTDALDAPPQLTNTGSPIATLTPGPGTTGSNPVGSGATDLSSYITDIATAAQVGLGIFNQTQGGPAVNPATGKPAATTVAGFSLTTIVIGLILIVGVIVAVRYASK